MSRRALLITGGAGFIGSALVRRAVAAGVSVLNVDKLTYAASLDSVAAVESSPHYQFARGDICDRAAMRDLIHKFRPSSVVHLAAESHVDRSIDHPDEFMQTNVLGTFAMLAEAYRYWSTLPAGDQAEFRFVHVSTDEVFGSLGDTGMFSETSPYQPSSPYSASKAGADHIARAWHHTYGLPVIVTNSSNNYGPFQFPEKLIPLAVQRALAGKSIPVYGSGSNVRDWLYVNDHAEALFQVSQSGTPGDTYLVGARAERTNLEVVRELCSVLDEVRPTPHPHHRLIEFVRDRPGHDHRYAIDPSNLERSLGWTPSRTFEAGLRETVQWYLDNVDWCERVQAGKYDGGRLGLLAAK